MKARNRAAAIGTRVRRQHPQWDKAVGREIPPTLRYRKQKTRYLLPPCIKYQPMVVVADVRMTPDPRTRLVPRLGGILQHPPSDARPSQCTHLRSRSRPAPETRCSGTKPRLLCCRVGSGRGNGLHRLRHLGQLQVAVAGSRGHAEPQLPTATEPPSLSRLVSIGGIFGGVTEAN